jgi:hypothetical protein
MEKWLVIGGIWAMTVLCLTFFVRGASPAHSRAVALARARNARLKAQAQAQRQAQQAEAPKNS